MSRCESALSEESAIVRHGRRCVANDALQHHRLSSGSNGRQIKLLTRDLFCVLFQSRMVSAHP